MDTLIFIISVIILSETTILCVKNKKPLKSSSKRKVYVDTSTLMDGRILAVSKTGFISDDLTIPHSVLHELQLLADGKDAEKRARARFGLDIIKELERVPQINVEILQDPLDRTPVDDRLIELAHKNNGTIMTNDFNLNKVARAEGIEVLNINDLALVLRSEYLPGDTFTLKITSKGNNRKQGVGHLPDGTMVVIDNAADRLNQEVEVEFIRFLQTSAGRMMFARIAGSKPKGRKKN